MFKLKDVFLYRSKEDASTFFYLPEPLPETKPDGRPTLHIIDLNNKAILLFGSVWSIQPDLLKSLKEGLSEKFQGLQKESIMLSFPQIFECKATLYLGDGSGKFRELLSVKSSGYPPFTAVFNVILNSEDKEMVLSSLNGQQDFLKICYTGYVQVKRETRISIYGDLGEEILSVDRGKSIEEALVFVEYAILKGILKVERYEDEGISQNLKDIIYRQAKEKAALFITTMASESFGQPSQTEFKCDVSDIETVKIPVKNSADISSWFKNRA